MRTELCEHCGDRVPIKRLDSEGWCDQCTNTGATGSNKQQQRNQAGVAAARAALRASREEAHR